MRVAPLGLSFPPIEAFKYGCKTAALTHGHPTGYLSAGFLSCLIAFIIRGNDLHDAIINTRAILQTYQGWEEVDYAVLSAIYFSKTRPKSLNCISSMGGGWVAEEALSIALYCCLSYPDNFDKAIALAVNHGGDSDSTGAITGNIIGACIGHSGIAKNWLDNLENYELLLNTLHIFTKHLSSKS